MSDNTEKAAALASAIEAYATSVKRLLDTKVKLVKHAESSSHINGQTYQEFINGCLSTLHTHAEKKGNVHNETPADYGMMGNSEFKDEVNQRYIPNDFMLSRWGSLNFLPVGVSGSFEGSVLIQDDGVQYIDKEVYSLNVEDDGTLVFVRNSTDGRRKGAYYGYIPNALDGLSKPTLTSTRYRLLGCPVEVDYVYEGGQGAMAGRLDGVYNGGRCFLALMNGTLDCNQHRWVVLPEKYHDILRYCQIITDNNKLYMVEKYNNTNCWGEAPIEFRYWSFEFKDQKNGTLVELEQIKVQKYWTIGCSDWQPGPSDGRFQFAKYVTNQRNLPGPSLVAGPLNGFETGPSGHGSWRAYSAMRNGVIRTLFEVQIRSWSNNWGQDWWTIWHTFYFDTKNGVAWTQDGSDGNTIQPMTTYVDTANSNRPMFKGNMCFKQGITMHALGYDAYNNPPAGFYYMGDRVISSNSSWGRSTSIVSIGFDSNVEFYDHLDCYHPRKQSSYSGTGEINAIYGSPIGSRCTSFVPLGNGWALTRARDANGANRRVYYRYDDGKGAVRKFNDYEGKSRVGFNLNTDRYFLEDVPGALSRCEASHLISVVDGDNVTVRGSYWSSSSDPRRPSDVNWKVQGSNWRTIDKNKAEEFAKKTIENFGYPLDQSEWRWELIHNGLIYNQAYLFVICKLKDRTRGGMYVSRINIQKNSSSFDLNGIIDSMKLKEDNPGFFRWIKNSEYWDQWGDIAGNFQMYRVQADGGWLFSWQPTFLVEDGEGVKNPVRNLACFGFINDDGSIYERFEAYNNGWIDRADNRPCVLPGKGVGLGKTEAAWTTNVFYLGYTRKSNLNGWGEKDDGTVIGPMEVASGWSLYISESIPAVIRGRYFNIEPTTIDLRTIKDDPSNTTFHLCLMYEESRGTPYYQVFLEDKLPGYGPLATGTTPQNCMYLGNITTGNDNIVSLDIQKRTYIDGVMLSTKPTGSAIPVSTGTPDKPNTLSWI